MNQLLKHVVDLSTEALEVEESALRLSMKYNPAYKDSSGGILSINNERYYQFSIAKYFYQRLPMKIGIEENYHDLVIYSQDEKNKYTCVIEMKRWMSGNGKAEIPGIQDDIKILRQADSDTGILLIFSSNPIDSHSTDENINELTKLIDMSLEPTKWYFREFTTLVNNSQENIFWVAGYEVKRPCK